MCACALERSAAPTYLGSRRACAPAAGAPRRPNPRRSRRRCLRPAAPSARASPRSPGGGAGGAGAAATSGARGSGRGAGGRPRETLAEPRLLGGGERGLESARRSDRQTKLPDMMSPACRGRRRRCIRAGNSPGSGSSLGALGWTRARGSPSRRRRRWYSPLSTWPTPL